MKKKPGIGKGYSYGTIMFSMCMSGAIVGYAFDVFFKTLPLFLIVCLILGFIGSLIKLNEKFGAKSDKNHLN